MPTSLTLADHLTALETAGRRLVEEAEAAGLDAPVPSCPAWDAAALLAHQTMVHRWATAHITGADPDQVPNQTTIRETVTDLPAYFRDGCAGVLAALRDAPGDLQAMTFLKDAPAPREFWARRQAHETTMHMVDALAARLRRLPTAAETGIASALGADGVDELLCGFFTRGKSKLFDGEEYTIAVTPTDSDRRWLVHVAEKLTTTPGGGAADATLSGPAAALYLALWNRGDEIEASGRPDVLASWRASQHVRWS